MKLIIDIPKNFEKHFYIDRFEVSFHRLFADVHSVAGLYERELVVMLIESFKKAKVVDDATMNELAKERWIPCSEPPKNEGTYLVYAPDYRGGSSSAKENHNGVMFSKYKNGKWSIEHGYYKRPDCVKAWMPLPEPYGGDSK